jgi:hypothetical protein
MKRMLLPKLLALAVPSFLFLAVLWPCGSGTPALADGVCPSPAPSCTSSGTLGTLSGTFTCTMIGTRSDGVVKAQLILVDADGSGSMSVSMVSNSNDSSTSATFGDFSAPITASYCINSDNTTGYITPPSGNGCPLAFVIDNGNAEVRLLNSDEQRAETGVCHKQ